MTLEIELGITGGEEDGIDNSDVDSSKLYTQLEEVAYAYEELMKVSDKFTVAAAFGNVRMVFINQVMLIYNLKYLKNLKYTYKKNLTPKKIQLTLYFTVLKVLQ